MHRQRASVVGNERLRVICRHRHMLQNYQLMDDASVVRIYYGTALSAETQCRKHGAKLALLLARCSVDWNERFCQPPPSAALPAFLALLWSAGIPRGGRPLLAAHALLYWQCRQRCALAGIVAPFTLLALLALWPFCLTVSGPPRWIIRPQHIRGS